MANPDVELREAIGTELSFGAPVGSCPDQSHRSESKRSDSEIAAAVQCALRHHVLVLQKVTANVQRGSVTLEGQVTWNYQRSAAELATRHLVGVLGVVNLITLKPELSAAQLIRKIQGTLQLQAKLDARLVEGDTSVTKPDSR